MLVLTYTGRKSGKEIEIPINYQIQPDGSLLATSLRSRTWWRNLRDGASVMLRLQGRNRRAMGKAYEDSQSVVEGLRTFFLNAPKMAQYFNVPLNADGSPEEAGLANAALERVIIRFTVEKGNAV